MPAVKDIHNFFRRHGTFSNVMFNSVFDEGNWIGKGWLNGDETHQGQPNHLYEGDWKVQRIKLYHY